MTILLFGKSGQLASLFVKELTAQGKTCVAMGRERCDVTKKERVDQAIANIKPELIINASGYTNVDHMEGEGKEAGWRLNDEAVGYMVEGAKRLGVPFLHFSTDYVFDGQGDQPYREEDPVSPVSEYGKSKAAGERRALAYEGSLVLRVSWLYGEGQQNFVHKFLARNTGARETTVTGDEVSCPTAATTLTNAALHLLRQGERGLFHIRDMGPDRGISRAAWARTIADLMDLPITIHEVPLASWNLPAQRPHYSVLAVDKAVAAGVHLPDWKTSLATFLTDRTPSQNQARNDPGH